MTIIIEPPTSVPDCPAHSKLVDVSVNGDYATIQVWPDRSWSLLRAAGKADDFYDWTFVADAILNGDV